MSAQYHKTLSTSQGVKKHWTRSLFKFPRIVPNVSKRLLLFQTIHNNVMSGHYLSTELYIRHQREIVFAISKIHILSFSIRRGERRCRILEFPYFTSSFCCSWDPFVPFGIGGRTLGISFGVSLFTWQFWEFGSFTNVSSIHVRGTAAGTAHRTNLVFGKHLLLEPFISKIFGGKVWAQNSTSYQIGWWTTRWWKPIHLKVLRC